MGKFGEILKSKIKSGAKGLGSGIAKAGLSVTFSSLISRILVGICSLIHPEHQSRTDYYSFHL